MSANDPSSPPLLTHLADSAPRTRVTTGFGTVAQKTWNLHRPVSIIGSARQSHICLTGTTVSHSHCALVNTGTAVLIKDLHTQAGTLRNSNVVRLDQLDDGDVLRIGPTPVQIAIRQPFNRSMNGRAEDRGRGNPLALPVKLRLAGPGGQTWDLVEAVSVLGTDRNVEIRLDDAQVSSNHALICGIDDQVVLVDLGTRTGSSINGRSIPARQPAVLADGDGITLGATSLTVRLVQAGRGVEHDGAPRPAAATAGQPLADPVPWRGDDLDARLESLRTNIQCLGQRLVGMTEASHPAAFPVAQRLDRAGDPIHDSPELRYESIAS